MTRDPAGVQLSLATTGETKSGTFAWQLLSTEAVTSAGQEPLGGVVSATITDTFVSAVAPHGSLTFNVMTLVPMGNEAVNDEFVPKTAPWVLHSKMRGSPSGSLEPEPFRVTEDWQSAD